MVTRSPTRTSRSSETDIEESIARREFVTFMTRPVTVLPRLALTASTRTGRFEKNRTSFAGTWTPVSCAIRPTSAAVRRSSLELDAMIARSVLVSTFRVSRRALREASRTARRAVTVPSFARRSSAAATLTSRTSFAPSLVARATSAPEPTITAFAAAFAAARSAWAWVTPWAASCAAGLRGHRSDSVASPPSSNRRASAWRASSTAAFSAPCLAATSAFACAWSRWPLAVATAVPDDAFAAAACAASSLACAVATRRLAVPTASRAVLMSMRACATSAGRTVRCACSTLLWAWSRASRACAAAASATCNWSSCASVGPNGSQPSRR